MGKNLVFIDELLGQYMPWLGALPGFAGAVALLVVPGLLLSWALGLKAMWAAALAPVMTSSLVAVAALGCWWLGVEWHLSAFCLVVIFWCTFVFAFMRWANKRWPMGFTWVPDRGRLTAGYWWAFAVAAILVAIRYVQIVESPKNINQGIDAPFHYNLIQHIIHSGDASPFSMRGLMRESGGFYPQIWHALTALLVNITGLPVVEAANAINLSIVAVSWPLGVLLLARLVNGRSNAALLVAAVASAGFFAFPFTLLQSQKSNFGPLFPYMLALTFLPPLMSVLASALKFGETVPMPWPLAAATLTIGLVGAVSTHVSILAAWLQLSAIVVLCVAASSFRKLKQSRADPYKYLQWAAIFLCVFTASLIVWVRVRVLDPIWPSNDSLPSAAMGVLLAAPTHGEIAWLLAALVLVGTVLLVQRPPQRWFLSAYAVAVVLYLVAAAVPHPLVRSLATGAWYADPPRLAAFLPMFWVVLTGAAGAWAWETLRRGRRIWVLPPGLLALGASVILFPTASESAPGRERSYAATDVSPLLTPDELELLDRVRDHVPGDAVIANNPWDGSSTAYAITGRQVLFAHAFKGSNEDRILVADKLNQAHASSDVCAAAKRQNIHFLLEFGDLYIEPERSEVDDFPGLDVPEGSSAFVKVDQQGSAVLYKLVACDS